MENYEPVLWLRCSYSRTKRVFLMENPQFEKNTFGSYKVETENVNALINGTNDRGVAIPESHRILKS